MRVKMRQILKSRVCDVVKRKKTLWWEEFCSFKKWELSRDFKNVHDAENLQ